MPEFRATSIDEAKIVGADVFHRHGLRVDGHDRFQMRIRAAAWQGFVIGTLEYSSAVRIRADAFGDSYQVNVPLFGTIRADAAGQTSIASPIRAVAHGPDEGTSLEGWAIPTRVFGVKVPRDALDDALLRMHDGGARTSGVSAQSACRGPAGTIAPASVAIDLDAPGGRDWIRLARRIAWWRVGGERDVVVDDTLRESLATALAVAMRASSHRAAGGSDSAASAIGQGLPADSSTALAVALMHARADVPGVGIAEIARDAGLGVRALEKRVLAGYATTPLRLFRSIRLAYAHRDLAHPTPEPAPAAHRDAGGVGRVAATWGFAHAGRFSAAYEQRFGELPSVTRARAAAAAAATPAI